MLYLIIALVVGLILGYIVAKQRIQIQQHEIDLSYQEEENRLKLEFSNFQAINKLQTQELIDTLKQLTLEKDNLTKSISDLKRQAEEASKVFYEKSMSIARAQLEKDYSAASQEAEEEYKVVLADLTKIIQATSAQYLEKQKQLSEVSAEIDAIVKANKLIEKERADKDFNRCVITEQDQQEIEKIRSIAPYLRDQAPLNKIIWKVYYEKPATDMIGRVLGPVQKTGIYKITNVENGMCYVGQATSVQNRWLQHIKRGIGAESPTRNKLYPAMYELGVENFTFELLEECSAKELDKKEDTYQAIFHAKDWGYSIK